MRGLGSLIAPKDMPVEFSLACSWEHSDDVMAISTAGSAKGPGGRYPRNPGEIGASRL